MRERKKESMEEMEEIERKRGRETVERDRAK